MNNKRTQRQFTPWLLLALLATLGLAARAGAADKPVFMWRVQEAKATVYLLGSMHAAKSDLYPLDPRIEKAYTVSDVLVVEANILEGNPLALAGEIMTKASYPPGDTLQNHVSAAVFNATSNRVAEIGLPMAQFQQVKPWFLAMTLTMMQLQALGISAEQGIDLYFLQQAMGKKKIIELESAIGQLQLISGFTDKEQELFLKYTISEMDQFEKSMNEVIAVWKNGDAAKLDQLLRKSLTDAPETKAIYTKLFDDRNKKMTAKIEEFFKTDNTYFVVVGAGHLVGQNGLVDLLAAKHKIQQQ